ncbi:MAG: hypothetical protein LBQ61_04825 [Spirochaetales bacterium]|jgi:hypothetical protein|nr:hypothetical protein [Spirochaetales bacterium]
MGKQSNKPVYEFGELDRTRKNLGELSPDEARRVASLLGGQVGVEKDSAELMKGYEKISHLSRVRPAARKAGEGASRPGPGGPPASGESRRPAARRPAPPVKTPPPRRRPGPRVPLIKMGWLDRLRTNWTAAKGDHNILPLGAALSSLFPFSNPRETIKTSFIKSGQKYFYQPLANIQEGLKRLAAGSDGIQNVSRPMPFDKTILKILLSFNLGGLKEELAEAEKNQRNLALNNTAAICQFLFTPVIKLQNLDMEAHILPAIKRYGELWRQYYVLNKNQSGLDLLRQDLDSLITELPKLFYRIHYNCYPLLMKLCCPKYADYNEFYRNYKSDYLAFLNLQESDLLSPPSKAEMASVKSGPQGESGPANPAAKNETTGTGKAQDEEKQKEEEKEKKKKENDKEAYRRGVDILNQMFPKAGFDRLEQFPDLMPYFSTLIKFPKNFELLPPGDPLHPAAVLMIVLKELFFGVNSAQFGPLKTEDWDEPNVQDTLERYTGNWFQFIEDFLPNQILDRLLTFCRGIEKGLDFAQSDYGRRLESDIYWQKRLLFFPYIKMHNPAISKPPTPAKFMKLSSLTKELKELFRVLIELSPPQVQGPVVKNMNAPIKFPIESAISKRFFKVLKQKNVPAVNGELFKAVYSILAILSELINSPDSFWNRASVFPIYRATQDGLFRPIYNLPIIHANDIIHESDIAEVQKWTSETGDTRQTSVREGFLRDLGLTLKNMLQEKFHSVVILFSLSDPGDSEILFSLISTAVRGGNDHVYKFSPASCGLLMTKISADDAVIIVSGIFKKFFAELKAPPPAPESAGETAPPENPEEAGLEAPPALNKLTAGITPLNEDWPPNEALNRAQRALDAAQKRQDSAFILFDEKRQKYRLFTAPAKT